MDRQRKPWAAAAKSLQLCLTLCDPKDISPLGSSVPGILQARILEWNAISFSNAWKWKVKVKSFSCVLPSATPGTAAYQAPPSMGFSKQEYWSGLPLPSPVVPARNQKSRMRAVGRNPLHVSPMVSSSFLAIFVIPRLVKASPWSLLPSSHGILPKCAWCPNVSL